MNVRITCPHCNFTTEVPRERIPANAKAANCPRCKQRFALSPETLVPLRPAEPSPPPAPPVEAPPVTGTTEPKATRGPSPWEDRSRLGLWQGIFQTFRDVLFNPINMFRNLQFGQGLKEPLAFGLLFGSVGMMFSMFWQFLMAAWGLGGSFKEISAHFPVTLVFLGLLILTPFIVGLLLFIVSGIMQLLLRMVGGGAHGFEATFRVIAYGQAAQVFAVIPFLGGFVASLWLLVVEVIGLREMHETSYLRVILAFAIPIVLICILVVVAIAIPLIIALSR
ncbi:MAG: YIP1 family protein [Desulfobacteraceae bacterium]|jgi:predicted Zn finger-like uncharacterized protein